MLSTFTIELEADDPEHAEELSHEVEEGTNNYMELGCTWTVNKVQEIN